MFIRVTGTGREKFARMKSTPSIRTARKQRLGQGNVFTGVRLSTGAGRGFRACITGHMTGGVRTQWEGSVSALEGWTNPHPPLELEKRAVHILLKYFLGKLLFYRQPTKLLESNLFSCLCVFLITEGPCDHYP